MADAGAIVAAITAGRTTAVAVTEDALRRADAAAALNAFTRIDPERALEQARSVDRAIAAGRAPGPLTGVPIAVKDIVDEVDIPTTAGSSFLDEPAPSNATVVDRLLDAGAIVIGRTGLHEFAYGFSSENDWWGPVRNPWNPSTSPGGSSGGSASAVAAGIVPLAIGTDTGGSIRVPAAMCGLIGLKVTHGRIPLTGVFPLASSLDTVGPLARTVADAALMYGILAGHDPADVWSVRRPVEGPSAPPLSDLTVGVPHPWIERAVAPEQVQGFETFRRALEEAGATLVDLDLPEIDQRDLARFPGAYHEVADVHRRWFEEDPLRYGPTIRDRLHPLLHLTDADIGAARDWRTGVSRAFDAAFGLCDLIATPATAARSKDIGEELLDVGAGPEPYRPVLSWFTPLVNQAGLPAIALPIEVSSVTGLPPSIQLIGPAWSESLILGTVDRLDALNLVAHRVPPNMSLENADRHTMPDHSRRFGRRADRASSNPPNQPPAKE